MADNVPISAGSGTPIAADDIASVWHQRVKVQHGADGSATDVSTASPLPVRPHDSAAVVLDGRTRKVAVTPTISTSAYTSGDAVGGVMTFTDLLVTSGALVSGALTDKNVGVLASLELLLFSATVTATDNAAFAPTDAEALNYIGSLQFDRYSVLSVNAVAVDQALGIGVVGATLYGVLVARSTPTYGSTSDLQVTLYGKSD